jgi:hypothetical protein
MAAAERREAREGGKQAYEEEYGVMKVDVGEAKKGKRGMGNRRDWRRSWREARAYGSSPGGLKWKQLGRKVVSGKNTAGLEKHAHRRKDEERRRKGGRIGGFV